MSKPTNSTTQSAFTQDGFSASIGTLKEEMKELYLSDNIPWVIGYSGGKDSSSVLQLVWTTISEIPPKERTKPIHVITTDTLVENPIVAIWVKESLQRMKHAAEGQDLPIHPHLLVPEVRDTFWVNLIGKGYPAPRNNFRWCTERLKISPSTKFIRDTISEHGEVILLLGARKAESAARARSIARRDKDSVRSYLTAHVHQTNCLVYNPIQDWISDDVWTYLMRIKNPWNHSNKDLLHMYRGASEDNECPIVVDTSTPSCGNSRFGCWVCTLVDQDKSMAAMINNDEEKEWMLPLLDYRNQLDFRTEEARREDRKRRDFRRLSGHLSYYKDKEDKYQLVPGPYTQKAREYWLRRLLEIQYMLQQKLKSSDQFSEFSLVTFSELEEIRRIWVLEKHEIEDLVPKIYESTMKVPYPSGEMAENLVFDGESLELLFEVCNGDELKYELARNLLDLERQYRTMGARRGLFQALEKAIKRCYFSDKDDAHEWIVRKAELDDTVFISADGEEINPDGLNNVQSVEPVDHFGS